ncbi:MAG: hypothetical protein Q8P41_31350 [Pseudomonadota bacterium]|nr:hypothetical protein [Pseudomonadota bacterium]
MVLLLVLAGACNGCRPDFPNPPDTQPPEDDSAPPVDTSPDDSADSGPPPRCDFEEVEPNNSPDTSQTLPMELWACGDFSAYLDFDFFTITPNQTGWITIRAEAATRGSSANPQLVVEGGGEGAQVLDGYLTTDPLLVFPAPALEPYRITLAETNLLYGDDYEWFLLTSLSKEPVEWDAEEVEPNDQSDEAQVFPLDQTVFGHMDREGDFDWYKITTTYEGEQNLVFDVTAFIEGSAANLKLVLYDSDGVTELRTSSNGEISYDRDPYFQKKVTGIKDLYLLARTEDDRGSRFHWYTLSVTATPTE